MKKGMTRYLAILLMLALCIFISVESAHATATLRLYDGTTDIYVADGSAKDLNPATGAVTYNDTYGDFSFASVLVSTGVTYPITGLIDYPVVHLSSLQVSGAGTLDVYFSEMGFGPTDLRPFQSDIGGIAGNSVTGRTYVDGNNALFGTTTMLATFGPYSAGSFSSSSTSSFNPTNISPGENKDPSLTS